MRRTALHSVVLALALSAVACGGGAQYGRPVHHAERATVAGTAVDDEAFAGAVEDLLASEPRSKERQLRLEGVVARQMTRVAERFKARDRDRALASFAGAMYLVRAGELTDAMLGARGAEALRAAAEELSRRGDEGRARAAYEMLLRVAPDKDKADITGHLEAIAAWTRDTNAGGPMQTAGALESTAVARLLLEPSEAARDEAVTRTMEFIDRALAVRAARRSRGAQVTREEGLEAVRALETGAVILAAIHLRSADAQAAVKALEKVRELARPELVRAIENAADKRDSASWLELARMLRPPPSRRGDDDDFGRDVDLLRLASFSAATEAHRLDSSSPEPAAYVAATLVELGMNEAAPAVLTNAVKAQRDPRAVGLALSITMQAMARSLEAEEADGARRTFRAAKPVLDAADAAKLPQITSGRVYAMMGEIESREGRLEESRKLLEASLAREKSGSALLSLARIDWHAGDAKAANERIEQALSTDDATKDPSFRAELLLLQSDIAREQGDAAAARKPLEGALRDLAKVRGSVDGDERARIERLIARALDRFGAGASAVKALDRALEATPRDKRQAAVTIGQLLRHAFLKGDLPGTRAALERGIGAELLREDLVYLAIFVRVLERQTKATGESAAERVLAQASEDPRWLGRVAAFGVNKLTAEQLTAAASTPVQKTEALFYSAMARRLVGDAKGETELLKQVVASPGIDLIEWLLARDLLSGPRAQLGGPVPEVGLP